MAKQALYDYSKTPGSNSDIDGVDSTGATGLVKSGDNYTRSMMSHVRGFLDDVGAVNTVAGTGDAIAITLSSAPSALVDGMRLTFNASAANTTNVTLNVTPAGGAAFGSKKVLKWAAGVETALSANDIPAANALIELVYDTARDTAAGAWMLLGTSVAAATTSASGIVELATVAEALTGTDAVRAVTPTGLAGVLYAGADNSGGATITMGDGGYFNLITSTTAITAFAFTNDAVGRPARVRFNTIRTLTYNATSLIIPGAANITTAVGDIAQIRSLGSGNFVVEWYTKASAPNGINLGTSVASTSGTSIDFTGIPTGVNRVTVLLNGVSTSGSSAFIIQIGDSGGIETSGYVGTYTTTATTTLAGANSITSGYVISSAAGATSVFSGVITLSRLNAAGTVWLGTGMLSRDDALSAFYFAMTKTLSPGPIDRVRFTTVGGTDTFDLGTVNISYET